MSNTTTQKTLAEIIGEQVVSALQKTAIVLVVNQENQVVDYRVESVDDVVAELALNGFGNPIPIESVG